MRKFFGYLTDFLRRVAFIVLVIVLNPLVLFYGLALHIFIIDPVIWLFTGHYTQAPERDDQFEGFYSRLAKILPEDR